MASSSKREATTTDEPERTKKLKVAEPETEPVSGPSSRLDQRVALNPADCDLDFNIEGNGLRGSALYENGFAYCWSGARANVGITRGKYCFGCKIIAAQRVEMDDAPLSQHHLCSVGISRGGDAVGNLGETLHSFGFGGTGKFSNARWFSDYGEEYGVGDSIICAVDLDSRPMASIGFSKNGKWLGVAKHFNAGLNGLEVVDSAIKELQWESALFPHVLLKNVIVQMQFSIEDGLVPEEGYKPWASASEDGNAILGPTFTDPSDCEVIMMVGLPGSGKTTWAEKWVKEHPEKRYILVGTNLALDIMKVPGSLRMHNYGAQFDQLMDRATGIFNTLLTRASKMPRNFIIDQTNVYKNARKRKLKPFANYRKIAVVVFPEPEALMVRASKRFMEMGKEGPVKAINEMLANYVLPMTKDMPRTDEYFDQVIFSELDRLEAQNYLDDMKDSLKTKVDIYPYPHESSIQTYNGFPMEHSRVMASDIHSVQYSCGSPLQSHASPLLENQGSAPGQVGRSLTSFSPNPPSKPHLGYYSSSPVNNPSDELFHFESYRTYENCTWSESGSPQGGVDNFCQSYGTADAFRNPGPDSRDFSSVGATDHFKGKMKEVPQEIPNFPYPNDAGCASRLGVASSDTSSRSHLRHHHPAPFQRPPSLAFNALDAYARGPGLPSADLSVTGQQVFGPSTPLPPG